MEIFRKFFARRFLKKHHYCPKHLTSMKFRCAADVYTWYECESCEGEERRRTQNRITECLTLLGAAE